MVIKTKDSILSIHDSHIPNELKSLKNWVLWRAVYNEKQQAYSKVPYSVNGYKASSNKPNTWSDFNSVSDAYLIGDVESDGIGFVLSADNDYICLDIDNAIDEKGQITSDLARTLMNLTYCEISPSGTGLHCFFKGSLPQNRKKKRSDLDIELYDSKRFMTFTGQNIGQEFITDDQSIIDKLVERYFKNDEAKPLQNDVIILNTNSVQLSDDEVVELMLKSKQNDKIRDLLKGHYENYYNSPSEAVQSLLHYLAFYTGKNREQMERIFLNYNNLTDKWHSSRGTTTWGQLEIETAINNVDSVYQANAKADAEDDFSIVPTDENSVKNMLEELGETERAYMLLRWEAEGKKGRPPTVMTTRRCADILLDNLKFAFFNSDEHTRLAMYQYGKGVYTINSDYLKRVISWLEPKFNQSKADEVIHHIRNKTEVKEKTESPYLIPVGNGVFNTKTKRLEPFTPDYIFTTKVSTPYVKHDSVPLIDGWNIEEWINEIACGDEQIVTLLWQVINDSLNGNYSRGKVIFFVGTGRNGKGTFQDFLSNLVGDENVASLKVTEFDKRFMLSVLVGKTLVIGDDIPPNAYIDDSSNFKSVATGDYVQIEFKNKQPYRTRLRCTVIQSSNGLPQFKDKTNALLNRLLIVPFNADFNGQIENFKIKEEYINSPEVLEYVLYKALHLDFKRFQIPDVSKQLLDVYKQDNDNVYDFKVNVYDKWGLIQVPKNLVYYKYIEFCRNNGYKGEISSKTFHKRLSSHLSVDWDTEARCRFNNKNIEAIEKVTGHFDMDMIIAGKQYRAYKNDKLKVI